ncbi:hypothetical protein ACPRNU_19520, partial [Chromobacterium vaccinii]|uniref:hypothetical protein n=1 Tax=Chromobacterium vaccinii TaxID=1108595 RepID=UPI003C7354EC
TAGLIACRDGRRDPISRNRCAGKALISPRFAARRGRASPVSLRASTAPFSIRQTIYSPRLDRAALASPHYRAKKQQFPTAFFCAQNTTARRQRRMAAIGNLMRIVLCKCFISNAALKISLKGLIARITSPPQTSPRLHHQDTNSSLRPQRLFSPRSRHDSPLHYLFLDVHVIAFYLILLFTCPACILKTQDQYRRAILLAFPSA